MTINEAIKILKAHNAWRRHRDDEKPLKMQNPVDVGRAIDVAVKVLSEIANKD